MALTREETVKSEKAAWDNVGRFKNLLVEIDEESERELKFVLEKANIDTSEKLVLDIGAVTGHYSKLFKKDGYVGIDIAIPTYHLRVNLILASFYNLPFKADTFDLVFVNATAHHSSYLNDFIDEASRVLKNNGTIFFSGDPFGRKLEQMVGLKFEDGKLEGGIEFNYLTWRYYYGLRRRFNKVKMGTYQRRTYLKLRRSRTQILMDFVDMFSWIPLVFFFITNRCFWRYLRRYWISAQNKR